MFSTKGITDEMVRLVGKGVGVHSGELAVVKSSSISGRVGNGLTNPFGGGLLLVYKEGDTLVR